MREKMHYQRLPISCLKPTGWYKKQLQLQADGTGTLVSVTLSE